MTSKYNYILALLSGAALFLPLGTPAGGAWLDAVFNIAMIVVLVLLLTMLVAYARRSIETSLDRGMHQEAERAKRMEPSKVQADPAGQPYKNKQNLKPK